ncbi:unnamed protein product [Rotaria magnacalcarata]|uniref:Dymeclin n=2 Tax=Rotaria magnacalcarata TaxID=392030 RepID=A0A815ZZS1_9BILA|nr:unnamed protein product [Rotaria magnacalcarata]CAF1591756.1 unnamed protein product [Rotaria magnacalcarata]CAF2143529.1 unnamed protein product [Rotaria magnacalcarata]
MGAQYSSLSDIKTNEYVSRFISEEAISTNDPFWNQFLSFSQQSPFTSTYSKLLDESCLIHLQQFVLNNPKTKNYGTLIEVFIRFANIIHDDCKNYIVLSQTHNALFILRLITKYFIEIDCEQNLYPHFLPQDTSAERLSLMTLFVDTLFRITITQPVESDSYSLHLEVLNTLLSLLSIQMCAKEDVLISAIYSIFMHRLDPLLISEFTRTLLEHFIKQTESPSWLSADSFDRSKNDSGGLFKIGQSVASSLWSVVTLGMGSSATPAVAEATVTAIDSTNTLRNHHLANQSIHLLLILSNHFTNDLHRNPYRLALLHFTDTQDTPTNLPDSEPLPWFSIDYHSLYDVLCQTVHTDQSTILLYMLLHRNQHFKAYVISRTNIDQIVLPILRVIYTATERNSHHIYMSLIILLILTEDDYFNRTVHDIKLKKLSWYTERSINDVTLGGLLISIVLRTIQYNIARMRDKYLHTNCLATLANMSSQFQNLHTYITQRIISLFNSLSRKHSKILDAIQQQSKQDNAASVTVLTNNIQSVASNDESFNENIQDLSIIEDVMRMILEIINSCLTHTLRYNVNLIYALLYNREIFDYYRTHPSFQDILQNIDTVITFFAEKVDQLQQRSAEYIKETLEINVKQFPLDRLKKFPDLKFKYVEEEQPEDFFVPYVWSLVHKSCNFHWSSESALMFLQQPLDS